jgi:hypothetical protein
MTTTYPEPPGWQVPQSRPELRQPAGQERTGPPSDVSSSLTSRGRPHCVARNKPGGGHGAAGLRCAQRIRSGDPDYLCGWHRHWLEGGHEVETVDAWIDGRKHAAKTLHPSEHVPGTDVQLLDRKGHNVVQVRSVDLERFDTVEGRRDTQLAALAFVDAIIRGDIYAAPGVRLKAALWHLDNGVTMQEALDREELVDEIDQILENLRVEHEYEEPTDEQVIRLLSPKARTIVLTELAEQGIEWVDDESETG